MSREPLYPHVPKSKEAQFPHEPGAKGVKEAGVLPNGQLVLLKSGTEGWIKGRIVEYFDLIPSVGGMIYAGPGYKVHILEGKHKGETLKVPANYVKAMQPQNLPQTKAGQQKYVHVLSPGQTVLHYDDTIALEVFEKENDRVKKRGETPATGEILEEGKYKRIPQTEHTWNIKKLATFMEMAEWYCKNRRDMSTEDLRSIATKRFGTGERYTEFLEYLSSPQGSTEFIRTLRDTMRRHGISIPPESEGLSTPQTEPYSSPVDIHRLEEELRKRHPLWREQTINNILNTTSTWQRISDEALYESPCQKCGKEMGEHYWDATINKFTCPGEVELSASTINLLAKTEGDPLRKFCCRQCGECAAKELLEEGRFPDRMEWLRKHYSQFHRREFAEWGQGK